ncbi:sliding clamp DNA polymerase accessory protein [Escherichia phage CLB_P2]|uniref:Sliding clamp n=4 Tax=Dhakavirus TaxID=1914165 RepID=C4MZE6_9CAUD|nr:DNA polymerase processivity factor [Escherichia phage JS98]YP_002922400.1 DNA polymerase processivity factor [Escherichia phage JS10]YP_010094368.1 DNA polymerase processivity factor [Enterobacteria phage vB_EcoM_IME281]QAY00081.1 sliding clamp DNA polymerase accessory protein [Escherichia phage EcWhh-1]QBP35666.1 sliding clamp DNA polymerase accessory protein [Phage NC-G]QHR70750.1 sliding clamp DNA polymerase accessory protein [Escherichia phage dhaeg]QHR72458.1 sliding clamp DNA polymer
MKFSKETLNILKNFSGINPGIMLKPGNTILTRSVTGASYGEATVSDTFDIEAAIYDLNGFLSILSLVSESAEVSVSEDQTTLIIKDQRSTIKWPIADPSTIAFPSKAIPFPVAEVIFDLKAEDYQQLMRVSSGLSIDTFAITVDDGKIVINGYKQVDDKELTRPLYSLVVADHDGPDFKFIINKTNMKMMPADYHVLLWARGEGQDARFAAKFEGTQASYVLAMEAGSSHSF